MLLGGSTPRRPISTAFGPTPARPLVVGAYRHARRGGTDLAEIAGAIDTAARTHPGGVDFATGVLARLDAATGHVSWMACGHPHPLIVRRGAVLAAAQATPGLPCGLGAHGSVVGDIVEVDLEPGDGMLLYTDGVTEARTPNGDFFGEERLSDLLAREHVAGDSPQEVVRRLVRTTIEHTADAGLRDDASMLYIHWAGAEPVIGLSISGGGL